MRAESESDYKEDEKGQCYKKAGVVDVSIKNIKTLITHEASREQYLVRIAGQKSRAFSYKHCKSKTTAKKEAEQWLAASTKSKSAR